MSIPDRINTLLTLLNSDQHTIVIKPTDTIRPDSSFHFEEFTLDNPALNPNERILVQLFSCFSFCFSSTESYQDVCHKLSGIYKIPEINTVMKVSKKEMKKLKKYGANKEQILDAFLEGSESAKKSISLLKEEDLQKRLIEKNNRASMKRAIGALKFADQELNLATYSKEAKRNKPKVKKIVNDEVHLVGIENSQNIHIDIDIDTPSVKPKFKKEKKMKKIDAHKVNIDHELNIDTPSKEMKVKKVKKSKVLEHPILSNELVIQSEQPQHSPIETLELDILIVGDGHHEIEDLTDAKRKLFKQTQREKRLERKAEKKKATRKETEQYLALCGREIAQSRHT